MKTTLEYLKDRYSEEQSRFDHFENKCTKFITFVSIIIGVITAVAGISKGIIFRPENPMAWVVLIAFLIGAFSIACAWGHSLLALRIGECHVLPHSRVAAEYLTTVDAETQSTYLYDCYIGTLEQLAKVINEKSKNLEFAYQELVISAWGLAIAASLSIYMEIAK